jgi:hypothetical protein
VVHPLIMEHLPWLKIVGVEIVLDCHCQQSELYGFVADAKLKFSCESKLEHLITKGSLPQKMKIPNLKRLYLKSPKDYLRSLQALESCSQLVDLRLDELEGFGVDSSILRTVGARLDTLFLGYERGEGDLFEVFHYCPNLSRLDLHKFFGSPLKQTSVFKSKISSHNFRLLKDVSLNFHGPAPKDLLKMIVAAPLMKRIYLSSLNMTREDCQLFQDTSDEKFKFLEVFEVDEMIGDDPLLLEDLALSIKTIVCSAPVLQEVKVSFKSESLQKKWEARKDVQLFTSLVKINSRDRISSFPNQYPWPTVNLDMCVIA